MLVVAGLDGPQAWTSGVALEAARGLLTSPDAEVRRLLAEVFTGVLSADLSQP